VEGDGENKGVCWVASVSAARVIATFVAMVPASVPVPLLVGRLQAVRRMIRKMEIVRREKVDFICINTPSFSIRMQNSFALRRFGPNYRTILFHKTFPFSSKCEVLVKID
jgi:magnesium-transporting ATPase (P-type)